ncbi:hypothetical protein P5673_005746 [Acropora cervicornis]|uniref:Uncharacterized protein n=1 Tax=Acropora cervicornis TaxID=6130 RepID=A0AAD9QZB5_ACRCE|nr:hypothetical protein P5673_005746 [Acropora cervicornis]
MASVENQSVLKGKSSFSRRSAVLLLMWFVRIGEKTCKVTNETAERVYGLVNVTGSVYILHKGNQRISKKEVF